MSKRGTFANTWVNQTNLGKHFGMSAIAMGKKLTLLGLRGQDKQPTEQALSEGFCRSTPLKDGTPFFMWNKKKVAELLRSSGLPQLSSADADAYETARALIAAAREADETGMDKLFFFMVDEVPASQYASLTLPEACARGFFLHPASLPERNRLRPPEVPCPEALRTTEAVPVSACPAVRFRASSRILRAAL